jgi:hypothetical protein
LFAAAKKSQFPSILSVRNPAKLLQEAEGTNIEIAQQKRLYVSHRIPSKISSNLFGGIALARASFVPFSLRFPQQQHAPMRETSTLYLSFAEG